MLCNICKGSGSFVIFNPIEWLTCHLCGGDGVLSTSIIKPTITIPNSQLKKIGANKKPKWQEKPRKP